MLSIKLKFNIYIVDFRSSYYIDFGVSRSYNFLQDTKNVIHYGLQAQNTWGCFSNVKLLESVQNKCMVHIFHHVWSSFVIMCLAFIVLLLKILRIFHILWFSFFFVYALKYSFIQTCFKYLTEIKCSKIRVETLQIFEKW